MAEPTDESFENWIWDAAGSVRGAKDAAKYKLAVPKTRAEETEIAEGLNALEAEGDFHRRKHATLTALFRTPLHQLQRAQLRVNQLDIAELGSEEVKTKKE